MVLQSSKKKRGFTVLLKELVDYLDIYLNTSSINDFCPNGIQIEGRQKIDKIATAVSANLQTIEKAIEGKIDVLVVHHGLFWNRDPYPIVGAKKKKIQLLLEHGISLLTYHLPLDIHTEVGNNWKAARDLGWTNLEPFGMLAGMNVGVKGNFTPRVVKLFVAELETYYQHEATTALKGEKMVQSAALISGGGYKELIRAAKENVDCFITGNFDEPVWGMAYEEGIHFLALGHSATERVGPQALGKHIRKQFNVTCSFIDVCNPF